LGNFKCNNCQVSSQLEVTESVQSLIKGLLQTVLVLGVYERKRRKEMKVIAPFLGREIQEGCDHRAG